MKYEWDTLKNESNILKHGFGFDKAREIFEDPNIITFEDCRFNYGERREISIGEIVLATLNEKIAITVVHTQRHASIRLISARKASQLERKMYEQRKILT
jgi:uncharacterized protein